MAISSVQGSSQIHERLVFEPSEFPRELFDHILSWLEPKDVEPAARVCKAWERFINETDQWKKQCQIKLGLSSKIDPKNYLPEGPSYKRRLELVFANILDGRVYERHIGEIGPVPRIPKEISLKKWSERDPCDPTKIIGREYVWMYFPSYIEIERKGYSLDKIDDPKDLQASKLIRSEEGPERKVLEKIEFGAQNTTLKVPVTINNLVELFKHPKIGNPSAYSHIWDQIVEQHGNERRPAGWICMKKDVIGSGLRFAEQQKLALESGVVLSTLLPRILFNFMQHVRSPRVNVYPDGQNPWTLARTSTLMRNFEDNCDVPLACGAGGPLGLHIDRSCRGRSDVGVAVSLPEKVQAH